MQHLYLYLDEFLEVKDVKEADAELDTYKKKQGRTALNPLVNRVIWGTYNLLKECTAFSSDNKKITDKMCKFILDFLLFLKLIDESHALFDNVIQTRATINYLIKSNYEPYPWSIEFFPSSKRSEKIKDLLRYW